ncbi:HD domain-containing protein [Nocardia sp. CDC186]|uniref:HD domain-containing protein n=1 Tax=Nocardia implantans TaxID=3108168 RepID=A0ABU6AZ99_9NOCA|nr:MULTISPECIES: HD domain-containing protein [unclassified Nocardia]MBF6194159.1 HD domain-containing protein [Nocardia beijingensis]MEA3529767.1 HD domain-containing protein [Nocardia sp. CDC192]MEB3512755.1 HD domain-containing protein [Nocardia sp. CDC186]
MTQNLVNWAADVAWEHLRALPRRLSHVEGVARRAALAADVADDGELLVAAGWLHDVGYAPSLVRTGFHPVDGATYLRETGASERLCALVANHSCARIEARNRGLVIEWPDEQSPLRDALWWADMTTTASGEDTTLSERLSDVYRRYGDGDVVSRSLREAEPTLRDAVERTEGRMRLQVK